MKLAINQSRIFKMLAVVVILLTVASVAGQIYKYHSGQDRYFVSFFDLDTQWNLPSWFASMSLFFSFLLLALITIAKKQKANRFSKHWAWLSMAFLFLSIDEASKLHEQIIEPLRILLNATGIFYFTWVIAAGLVLIFFGLAYLRFLVNLPVRFRNLFILSGALFVGGALGMEAVGGHMAFTTGQDNLAYSVATTIEELMEMAGVICLIYSLLSYIKSELSEPEIVSQPEKAELSETFSEIYEYHG